MTNIKGDNNMKKVLLSFIVIIMVVLTACGGVNSFKNKLEDGAWELDGGYLQFEDGNVTMTTPEGHSSTAEYELEELKGGEEYKIDLDFDELNMESEAVIALSPDGKTLKLLFLGETEIHKFKHVEKIK